MMAARRFALLTLLTTTATGHKDLNYTVRDVGRGRDVSAFICTPVSAGKGNDNMDTKSSGLVIFGHGGGLYTEDYNYLCDGLLSLDPTTQSAAAVAILISHPDDDPMNLQLMADDMVSLAQLLPPHSADPASPLAGLRVDRVVLAGHSMGGAAALLAGKAAPEHAVAVGALAPGFWGDAQAALLATLSSKWTGLCSVPTLIALGDQDCANSLLLQAVPVWGNLSDGCERHPAAHQPEAGRMLAVLKGATHCQWPVPARGACDFDKPCPPAQRLAGDLQRKEGVALLRGLLEGEAAAKAVLDSLHHEGALSYIDEKCSKDAGRLPSLCPCQKH
eukprot:CAMPEP_0168428176 /NCGR_PEP_ID=MMETSP0228-20121227/36725_1 /TAXON_ID=133427 /ORGANISM="Protoceratium reticulatum, Strain CCCM 535 (=CCMP 1889)" /LENGTH=331 /DNA_ID=CAMNT_0008442233 /DNA_START=1 /DNA_END=994 /DNA_ORIENTATION=+